MRTGAVAVFLLVATHDRARTGEWHNGPEMNMLGVYVVAVAPVLGGRAVPGAVR